MSKSDPPERKFVYTFVLKFSVTGTISDYPWCALKTGQGPGKMSDEDEIRSNGMTRF